MQGISYRSVLLLLTRPFVHLSNVIIEMHLRNQAKGVVGGSLWHSFFFSQPPLSARLAGLSSMLKNSLWPFGVEITMPVC